MKVPVPNSNAFSPTATLQSLILSFSGEVLELFKVTTKFRHFPPRDLLFCILFILYTLQSEYKHGLLTIRPTMALRVQALETSKDGVATTSLHQFQGWDTFILRKCFLMINPNIMTCNLWPLSFILLSATTEKCLVLSSL